jgi:DNA (cytosine-5)-methyltransferase 1
MKIPLLSFFTGGGFLDLGFEAAGFDVRWTNEYNSEFGKIYASGMTAWRQAKDKKAPSAAISNSKSIEAIDAESVLQEAFGQTRPEFFGVIGGPPCTDFSVGGLHAGHEGDAGKLTSVYVNMLVALKPGFFLLENVPHLETHAKHRDRFLALLSKLETAGYSFLFTKLNALDYGVPQDRLRLFVVGFRRDFLRLWYPEEMFQKRALAKNFKWPVAKYPNAKASYEWPAAIKFGSKPKVPVSIPLELCVHRAVSELPNPETLPNGKDFFNPYSSKFGKIKEGDVSGKSFKRLHRYRYSPTAWYGNNEVHLHPWKKRRLSVRESLRIQTVPDSYVMPKDDVPLCAKFKVIGNGVPCLLAQNIAEAVASFVESSQQRIQTKTVERRALAAPAELRC